MRRSAVFIFLLWLVNGVFSLIPIPLPANYTEGGVWPKPVKYISYHSFLVLRPASFNFKVCTCFYVLSYPSNRVFSLFDNM